MFIMSTVSDDRFATIQDGGLPPTWI